MFNNAYASGSITSSTEIKSEPNNSKPSTLESIQSGWMGLVPYVIIFLVFYFLLIRPNEKKRKQHENLINGVKKGEEIVTSSGIYGTVIKINDNDNTVQLEIAKDISIKILKTSITDIISRKQKIETSTKNK